MENVNLHHRVLKLPLLSILIVRRRSEGCTKYPYSATPQ